MNCRECGKSARFVGYRDKTVVSLVGPVRLSRGYYHCPHCGHGCLPWDETLSLARERLTPAAEEVVSLAGIQESFGKAAERTLRKMAGLHLSESTVERTAENAGARLGEQIEQGKTFGPRQPYAWNKDRTGKTCAYVSVDATGVLIQGSDGAKAEGRMINVGMVFNPQPQDDEDDEGEGILPEGTLSKGTLSKPCDGVRYLAGLYTLDELGDALRRQAAQVGMDQAERWIALSDGGNGLEKFFETHFPLAVKILDFQHAAGYLASLAKAWRPGPAGEKLLSAWCHSLKHAGGATVVKLLEKLDVRKMNEQTKTEHERTLNYLRSNMERMKYPEYLRNGWQIASGAVESACKTVVNQRLCMGGMRWAEAGSDSIAHLRALYRSDPDQWEAFWATAA